MKVDRDALELVLQTGGQMLGQSVFDVAMIIPDIYWPADEKPSSQSEISSVEYKQIESQLEEAVRKSFKAYEDKKIGLTLSGGVDSSLALYLIKKIYPDIDLVAYHTDYKSSEKSELPYAKIAAEFAGVPLRIIDASANAQAPLIEESAVEHKLIDVNAPLVYMAHKVMADDSVDVAVNGLGLDELFAGYTIHRRYYGRSAFRYLPFSKSLLGIKYYRGASRRWGSDKAWFLADIYPRLSTSYVLDSRLDINQIFDKIKRKYLWNTIHNYTLLAMINHFANNISVMAKPHGLDVIFPYMEHDLMRLCLSYGPLVKRNKAPIRKIMRESYGFPDEIPSRGETWDKLGWSALTMNYFDSEDFMNAIQPDLGLAEEWFTSAGVKELKNMDKLRSGRSLQMALFLKVIESS